VIKQDTSENQVKSIYLGIGSNLGNRKKNIELAKFNLIQKNIEIVKSSNFYETLSWPNSLNPKFLNIVIHIKTNLDRIHLLFECKKIEKILGRKKTAKNSPRTCDIDILDYDNIQSKKGIILPHPRLHKRNFVLFPLFEINKDWVHPVNKNHIKKLINTLPQKDIITIKQV
tara:strand:- start:526 stop:1038 length:513 start_codon:yes stop_codon:yes gene_type:complete